MKFKRMLPRTLVCALGLSLLPLAHADTLVKSGNFTADNSTFSYSFNPTSTTDYTFTTTSFATGGFIPVLTLYDAATGSALANDGPTPGPRDASLMEKLGAGSYVLFLTEFPSEADGNLLSNGFQFANDPYATGHFLSLGNVSFIDDIDGSQRTSAYSLAITSAAATPEPSSWLLMLSGAGVLAYISWRRRLA